MLRRAQGELLAMIRRAQRTRLTMVLTQKKQHPWRWGRLDGSLQSELVGQLISRYCHRPHHPMGPRNLHIGRRGGTGNHLIMDHISSHFVRQTVGRSARDQHVSYVSALGAQGNNTICSTHQPGTPVKSNVVKIRHIYQARAPAQLFVFMAEVRAAEAYRSTTSPGDGVLHVLDSFALGPISYKHHGFILSLKATCGRVYAHRKIDGPVSTRCTRTISFKGEDRVLGAFGKPQRGLD